ncbi:MULTISPECIES: glycosyltransferase family 4 protein [unclassified Nostoc]|uniref:glycosyltransferase family 4 protein n=1 Tax=unclassified Nostoc TaxID=2593658 RepID=UPI002AD45C76|nr:glycosyltransferase family 4 protein [Nostoc sp. DedQUE03]MDZ7976200.1 glycosyltransferase family 4 protein [Nostoc sp. DedQUE03]MDZ8046396.1 glycosyltransferase family 4 protein [Nostoc sp. DedQUE02]
MSPIKIIMLGESLDRQGGIVSVEKLILEKATSDIQIKHITTLPNGSALHKMLVFLQAIGELFWNLLNQKADLIHIHVSDRGSAFRHSITTLIGWLFRKPVIIHTHSADFHLFYSKLPQLLQQWLSWSFCKCTRFIVLSDSWKKFYIENLGLKPEQVIVLPNPVKIPPQIPQRINSEQIFFLFLGRIGERKGAFDLIKAFASIPVAQKSRAKLVMAGDGEVEQARSLIPTLNLTNSITILDWVDQEKRDDLLTKADVFVLPSYNEGLPMALLEAMSWGLAVITTGVGGIPEIVTQDQNGLLVNPGDIQQLSEAMQSLIANENLRISLGNNARLRVKHLDINNYFASLRYIYAAVIA